MSTLQRDELLTQSKILEKETSPPAKEANQHSEAEPYETWSGFIAERCCRRLRNVLQEDSVLSEVSLAN